MTGPEPPDDGPTQPAVAPPAAAKPRRRRRRWLARLGLGAAGLLGVVGVGALGTWAYLMTDGGQEWLRATAEGYATAAMGEGATRIGHLETDLLTYVRVEGVAIEDVDGREVVGVDRADASLRLVDLVRGVVRVTRVDVEGLRGDLRIADDGTLDIARLYTPTVPPDPDAPPWEGLPVDIVVDEIIVRDADVALSGGGLDVRVEDVDLGASFTGSGKRFEVAGVELGGGLIAPRQGPVGVVGDFVWEDTGVDATDLAVTLGGTRARVAGHARDLYGPGDVDLTLDVETLDMSDVDAFANAGLAGALAGSLSARGPLAEVQVAGRLEGLDGTDGVVDFDVVVDANTPAYAGSVKADALRLDHLIPAVGDAMPVSGTLVVDGQGSAWPDGIQIGGRLEDASIEVLGVQLDEVASGVRLEQGRLILTDAVADGAAGHVTGGGTLDLQSGRMDLDVVAEDLDTSALRSLYVPAELDGTRGQGTAHVGMDLYDEVVRVEVTGQLVAAPLRWTDDITARQAIAKYTVYVENTDVDVTGDIYATEVRAYGSVVPDASSRDVWVQVRSDAVHVKGEIEATGATYPLVPESLVADLGRGVEAGHAAGSWTVDVPLDPVGDVVVHVEADIGPHSLLAYPGQVGRVTFDMLGNDADIVAQLDAGPTRRLADVVGHFDLETMAFDFQTLQVAPVTGQTWTQLRPTRFIVDGYGVRDLSAELVSSRGRLTASGIVGLEGSQDLHVEVGALELRALSELLPMYLDGLEGYAAGVIDLDGTADAPVLAGAIDAEDVYFMQRGEDGQPFETVRNLGLRLAIEGHGGSVTLRGRSNVEGVPLANIDVQLPVELAFDRAGLVPDGPLGGSVVLVPAGLDRFSAVSAHAPALEGDASGRLRLGGTLVHPELHLSSVAELPTQGLDERLRVELHASRVGQDVGWAADIRSGLDLLARSRGGGLTDVDTVLAWALEEGAPEPDWSADRTLMSDLVGNVVLADVPLGDVVDLIGVPLDFEGRASGRIDLAGSLVRPRPSAHVRVEEGAVGPVGLDDVLLIAAADDEGYVVGLQADLEERGERGPKHVDRGSVYIAGTVPLVLDLSAPSVDDWVVGDMDVSVDVDVPISVAAAYDRGVRDADGTLEVDGFVTGAPFDPDVALTATVSEGATFAYEPLGVRYADLRLLLGVDRDAIRLTSFQASTEPARRGGGLGVLTGGVDRIGVEVGGESGIEASGTAALESWAVRDLSLTTHLKRALLVNVDDQVIRASTLRAAKEEDRNDPKKHRPLRVSGDLAFPIVDGGIVIDKAEVFLDYATAVGGGSTKLDPRLIVHRDGVEAVVSAEETSILDNVAVNVSVDVGRAAGGRLTMPLESLQFMGGLAAAVTRIDLRARLSGVATYRQLPCRFRDIDGRSVVIPSRIGKCGLFHPVMEGAIGIVEGTAKVFASDFTLTDSEISFVGNEVYNPNLNIHGSMQATDATIDMAITGTAYEPVPSFTSGDTDQVFLTLLTGRNPDDLGYDELVGVLTQVALQSLLSGVNLGTFNIDSAGKVVWGTTVSRELYVEATAGGVPRTDENTFEVEAELTVIDGAQDRMLTRVGVGGYAIPFWMDLLFEREFD